MSCKPISFIPPSSVQAAWQSSLSSFRSSLSSSATTVWFGKILCFECTNPFPFYFSDVQTVGNKDKGKIQTFDIPVSTYIPIVNIARLDIVETGSDSNLTPSLSKFRNTCNRDL